MSLCESVLGIIEDQARAQHFRRVRTVWVEIGRLSSNLEDVFVELTQRQS